MSTFQTLVWKNQRNNKIFTNLPIGMTEYKHKYKNIMKDFETRNEFYINTLYHIDPSYLEEMDEWNPNSSISMFNKWNGHHKMTLKSKREVCKDFNKVMSRYMYCEHLITEMEKKYMNMLLFSVFLTILIIISISLYLFIFNNQHLLAIAHETNNNETMENVLYLISNEA